MTNYEKIGVLSDIHEKRENLGKCLELLTERGATMFVANGDLGYSQRTIGETFEALGKTELPVFIQPGSHESYDDWVLASEAYSKRFSNLRDTTDPNNQRYEGEGFSLVFLPGSDITIGSASYFLHANDPEKYPTGNYVKTETGLQAFEGVEAFIRARAEGRNPRVYQNMYDLERLMKGLDPKTTTLFCHVPVLFENNKNSVDYANSLVYKYIDEEGELKEDGVRKIQNIIDIKDADSLFIPYEDYRDDEEKLKTLIRERYRVLDVKSIPIPVGIKTNRGNKHFREITNWQQIRSMITGHLHDGAHNQHTLEGKSVGNGEGSKDLFSNASCVDDGKVGLYEIDTSEYQVRMCNITIPGFEQTSESGLLLRRSSIDTETDLETIQHIAATVRGSEPTNMLNQSTESQLILPDHLRTR
jgi:hypothetical protein